MKKLTHPFIRRCINREELLKDCKKFNTFCYRLEKQADIKSIDGKGEKDEDIRNKYVGDGFELFVEFFINCFGMDMLIGIDPESYRLVDTENDYGVDGVGIGNNNKIHTVQIKYRQANWVLTANDDHLTNFTSLSTKSVEMGGYGVDPNDRCKLGRGRIKDTCNMLIIHSGKYIHYDVKENMLRDVKEIKRKDIMRKIDDNYIFWRKFLEVWEKSL